MDEKLRRRFGMVGLVLGPGGTRGAWQAGAMIPFKKYGIEFDYVASTSVGTLNAMGLVESGDPSKPAKIWQEKIRGHRDIFDKNPIKKGRVLSEITEQMRDMFQPQSRYEFWKKFMAIGWKIMINARRIWSTQNILNPQPLIDNVVRQIDIEAIRDSPIDWDIVCKEMNTWKKTYFSNRQFRNTELLFRAIVASFSIPGVFPPIEIGEKSYVDGAPALPIGRAIKRGCSTIFVICVHPEKENFDFEGSNQTFIPLPGAAKAYLEMMGAQISDYENDMIETVKATAPEKKIYILRPTKLPERVETLFISEKDRDALIRYGRQASEKLLRSLNLEPVT